MQTKSHGSSSGTTTKYKNMLRFNSVLKNKNKIKRTRIILASCFVRLCFDKKSRLRLKPKKAGNCCFSISASIKRTLQKDPLRQQLAQLDMTLLTKQLMRAHDTHLSWVIHTHSSYLADNSNTIKKLLKEQLLLTSTSSWTLAQHSKLYSSLVYLALSLNT